MIKIFFKLFDDKFNFEEMSIVCNFVLTLDEVFDKFTSWTSIILLSTRETIESNSFSEFKLKSKYSSLSL